ncbi:hypothetical protein PPYR_08623 [Photinus pyralis]|uniref:SprT-like domain-containing protein n=1 Tax=Photinus pyralis TaxID=7054 RepID=A0A5N4AJW6_PHOPY|nr:acidic repeat-containing protein-like [Photinus pyralis]KAB0797630.1 hypothetical protein PPYR_08623 [Photinus pyralis]
MDSSFVLLSSMSPIINKTTRNVQVSTPRLLALRRNIRRSSHIDNLRKSLPFADTVISIESSTTETVSSGHSKPNFINSSPIVISDSEAEKDIIERKSNERVTFDKTKFLTISDWVRDVNSQNHITPNDAATTCGSFNFNKVLHSLPNPDSFKDRHNTKSDCLSISSRSQISDSSNEFQTKLLDELYSDTWRNLKSDVLPKSAPNSTKKSSTKTNLKVRDHNQVLISPWTKFVRDVYDSDSSEDKEETRRSGNSGSSKRSNISKGSNRRAEQSVGNNQTPNGFKTPRNTKPVCRSTSSQSHSSTEFYCGIIPKSLPNSRGVDLELRGKGKAGISPWTKIVQNLCDSDSSEENTNIGVSLKSWFDADNKNTHSRNSGQSSNSSATGSSKGSKRKFTKPSKENVGVTKPTSKADGKATKVRSNEKKEPLSSLDNNKLKQSVLKPIPVPANTYKTNSCQSFLASLSSTVKISQCDPSARLFRNNFKNFKNELLTRLFKLYNEKVFDNKIPEDTPLEWNDKMIRTAGFCYCRKITRRTGIIERKARIVLSTKVVDACNRLRDTLIHELCHAATWIINGVDNGHGEFWKAWATKAITVFPELPPIKRCHDYVINTKYTYQCIDCGYSIGRHTKSLDVERKCCGYCYGKFEVFLNKTNKEGETKSVRATPKKAPSGFALFVKDNYATYKTPQLNHGQVMKLLGQKFNEVKVSL